MARQAQRDRAPEAIVHGLPWRVWTGTGWEKHEATLPPSDPHNVPSSPDCDLEQGSDDSTPHPSTSHDVDLPEWVEQQVECAICLEMFAKGDRVRVLPCYHMFHMDEVDEWLIQKKKLVGIALVPRSILLTTHISVPSANWTSLAHTPHHHRIACLLISRKEPAQMTQRPHV